MWNNRSEIEEVLYTGRLILNQRPDLAMIPFDQILDELDDGTKEMIHNRWGVLAQVIIDSITNWETQGLVAYLSQIECPNLARDYVGYALQNEHGIILEDLVIESEKMRQFDKIILYVSRNLSFLPSLHLQTVIPFLEIMENHRTHSSYHPTLSFFAQGVDSCNCFPDIVHILNPIKTETQYQLIYNMRRSKYVENQDKVRTLIGTFLSQKNLYGWKAAIDYCEWTLPLDKAAFDEYYPQIIGVVGYNDELKEHIVSLLVEYIAETASVEDKPHQFQAVLTNLKSILLDTPSARNKFIEKIAYMANWPSEIYNIFQSILAMPADEIESACRYLDTCFSSLLEHKAVQIILEDMFTFFSANKFLDDYMTFFNGIDSTLSTLADHADSVTQAAIEYISKPSIDCMFFGLGLLVRSGNVKKLSANTRNSDRDFSDIYCEKMLIRVMKAVLFYSFDDVQICNAAFDLLLIIEGPSDNYISFCIDVVFNEYPTRLHEIALHYQSSTVTQQKALADAVNHAYSARMALQEKARNIPDLLPSYEHQVIYSRALHEQSQEISKRANEMSIFADFFPSRFLKYGRRSGHIVWGGKGQHFYQSSPYQEIKHNYYLSATYVTDPVKFEMLRREFLMEVEENASDN